MDNAALWISFASFGAAAASAVVAWFQRSDALKSAQRAERAEESARDAQIRSNAALEALAFLAGPPWKLEFVSGDAYMLINNSPLDANEVVIDHDASGGASIDAFDGPQTIGPRSAIKFMFNWSLGTGVRRNLLVSWKREGHDDLLHWKYPFPSNGR